MAIYLGNLELATGGGTASGLPVNSYTSFDINTTSNPPGYDANTGIYSNPDGTYWLKTGSSLSGSYLSTFPNATKSGAAAGATAPTAYDSSPYACWIDASNDIFAVQHYNPTTTRIAEYSFATGAATGKVIDTNSQLVNGTGAPGGISYDPVNEIIWAFYRYNVVSNATELRLASYDYITGQNITNQVIYRAPNVSTGNNIPFGIAKINNTPQYVLYSRQNAVEKMQVYDMSNIGSNASLVSTVNTGLYASTYYYMTNSNADNKVMLWKYDEGKYVEFETTNFTATGVETLPISSFINTYGSYALDSNSKAVTNNSSYYTSWFFSDFIGESAITDSISGKPLFRRIG